MSSAWIRESRRQAIHERDGWGCVYCGAGGYGVLTLDHLHPRSLGGSNKSSNLVTCCFSCNSSRQDKPLQVFLAGLAARGIDGSALTGKIRRLVRRKVNLRLGKELAELAIELRAQAPYPEHWGD